MGITLAVVGIVTEDMARSLSFYRTLGLDLPAGVEDEQHVDVALPGGLRLAWDTPEVMRSFDPGWAPASDGHSLSIAFSCADAEEVDATYARMTTAGFEGHLPPWDAFWGQRYAVLRDPDGNSVDLFAGSA